MRPHQRIASRILARLEVTRPAEEEPRSGTLRHQLEGEWRTRRWVVGDAVVVDPRGPVVFDVDMQRGGPRSQVGQVRAMVETLARQLRRGEAERACAAVEAFGGCGARGE